MMLRSVFATIALFSGGFSLVTAQEVMELPEEIQKEMQFLAGDWTFTSEENGKTITGTYSTRWASGGTCLTSTFRGGDYDQAGLLSWDPATGEIVEVWAGPAIGRLEARWRVVSEKVWEGTSKLSGTDGKVARGNIRLEKTGDDSFRYTENTGGKTWDIENKRISRSEIPSNPHAKQLAAFLGDWEMELPSGEKRLWTFALSPRKTFLNNEMTNFDADGNMIWTLNGMLGWDGGIQKITNWCVIGSGERVKFVWTKLDDKTWEARNESGQMSWKFTPMGDKLRVVSNGEEMHYKKQ